MDRVTESSVFIGNAHVSGAGQQRRCRSLEPLGCTSREVLQWNG